MLIAEIVMTPSKKGKTTTIRIEKVRKTQLDESQVAHKAGGQHSGLVINKQTGEQHVFFNLSLSLFVSLDVCLFVSV